LNSQRQAVYRQPPEILHRLVSGAQIIESNRALIRTRPGWEDAGLGAGISVFGIIGFGLEGIDFAGDAVGAIVEGEGACAKNNGNGKVKGARLKAAGTNSAAG
jgi:hypothetical protein